MNTSKVGKSIVSSVVITIVAAWASPSQADITCSAASGFSCERIDQTNATGGYAQQLVSNSSSPTLFVQNSSSGPTVQGSAINGIGLLGTSQGGDGVQGKTTNASHSGVAGLYQSSTGAGIGVFGFSQSSAGFAVFSSGNLQVTGTPFCSGCTAFTNNSDARLKKNIESLGNPLSRLLQLRGVTFEWKEPEEHGNHAGTQRGFVAQEVEKVFPEWVGVDNKGFKTLNLTGLEPMLVESLRALKTENDALAVRVKKLEANQRPVGAGFGEGAFGLAVLGAMIGGLVISRRRVRSVL